MPFALSVKFNWRSVMLGFTLGLSLATFLQWLQQSNQKRRKVVGQQFTDETQGGSSTTTAAAVTIPSVDSYFSATLPNNHHSGGGGLLLAAKPLPCPPTPSSMSSLSPPNPSLPAATPVPPTQKEIAELGVSAIHQVIVHLQDALKNLEQLHNHLPESVEANSKVPLNGKCTNGSRRRRRSSTTIDLDASGDSDYDDADSITSSSNSVATTTVVTTSDTILNEVRVLLEHAVLMHESCQQYLTSCVRDYHPLREPSGGVTGTSTTAEEDSDWDSFVSAAEYIDLSGIQVHILACSRDDHLYRAALLELDEGNVQFREVRTKAVQCASDTEYLAKLHCLRLAFDHLMRQEKQRDWLTQLGCQSVVTLLQALQFHTAVEFQEAFQSMCKYAQNTHHHAEMREELEKRGVVAMNVYDVVFDFVLLDALESLHDPPSSLTSVIHNRWLSNSFKKTALDSAVWTLLLAKRKLLKHPHGFMYHFYAIAATVAPAFGWGFLSADPQANAASHLFKDCWMEFLHTLFSRQTRFTTVEDLAEDIQIAAKRCIQCRLIPGLAAAQPV